MAQRASWTDVVSDHVMEAQAIAMRAVREDGVVSVAEQAMLDAMRAAQETITEVDHEISAVQRDVTALQQQITGVMTTFRTGCQPRRMVRARRDDGPQAA